VRELLEETGAALRQRICNFECCASGTAAQQLCLHAAASAAQGCAVLLRQTELACCC
jgi:hypothetical protein